MVAGEPACMYYQGDLNNEFREAIIKVIVFFDLFDYPLTVYEIHKYLDNSPGLAEVINVLDQETGREKSLIQQKNGFYFLAGREEIVTTRQRRYNYAVRKIKIARRFARLFRLCPFVKVIAMANVIGSHNLRDESDIDFFIITTARRIWLARLYCAGLAKILNRRPRADRKKDKVCLSFYVSEEHLNLNDLKLAAGDPYFDYWRKTLVLLYNKKEVYNQFLIFNGLRTGVEARPAVSRNSWWDFLEKQAKNWQLKIMPLALKAAMNNSDGVVVNDQVLKLYLSDRRREFLEKYGNKINEVFKKNN